MSQAIFADLHNHTSQSDGDFTPAQIVNQAKSLGIKAVGITDHDTLNGLKTAVNIGEVHNIEIIPGVEVSVRFKRSYFTGTLHLLCYFTSTYLFHQEFIDEFNAILSQGRGEKLVRARVDEINKFFGPGKEKALLKRKLKFEDIAALSSNASRRHFAIALNQTFGITDKDTVNSIIGNDSPAYLPSGVALDQIKPFINKYDIVAVLAHPAAGSFPGKGHYKEVLPPVEIVEKILPEFLEAGIKGLEVYYPGHIKAHQDLMIKWAGKYDLLITGGSDCHDGKERPFGVQGIGESDFNRFKAALR